MAVAPDHRAHSRVSISGLCFPAANAVGSIAATAEAGARSTSLTSAKIRECGAEAVSEASTRHGVRIGTTTALLRFDLRAGADLEDQLTGAYADIDQAVAVGARSVYTLTGPRMFGDWASNAAAYADIAAEVLAYAAERGVRVSVEPTNWLYADLNFVHSFHDALALCELTGMGVCLDLFHVWTEATLLDDIAENIDRISHVQISGMTPGMRSLPCRDLLDVGPVPIRPIVEALLAAGYRGEFDLELSGPAIDAAGHPAAAARSATWLSNLLAGLGA